VVHTVGPIWRGGYSNEDELLASCYRASLALAEEWSLHSIAFPAISCGAFGFPLERASAIAVREIRQYLDQTQLITTVVLVARDASVVQVLRDAVATA
jgi:O-acetyl-ADP-ribose deacetylase (regulator of RNase III)